MISLPHLQINSKIEDKSNIKALEFDGELKLKGTFKGEKFTIVAKGYDNFNLNIDVAKSSANVFDSKKIDKVKSYKISYTCWFIGFLVGYGINYIKYS